MTEAIRYNENERTVSFFMPLKLKKRGGHKMILVPESQAEQTEKPTVDPALFKALIRAHLWQRQLKSGKYATMTDLAAAHKVTVRYIRFLLPLNFLSPQLKELILNGTLPPQLRLVDILGKVPILWEDQKRLIS